MEAFPPPVTKMLSSLSHDAAHVLSHVPVVSMLFNDKSGHGAAGAPWTVTLDVRLPGDHHAETVTLTVHTQGQMTLEWPGFGGVRAGKANFVTLPKIEAVLKESAATGSPPPKAPKTLASRMLGRSGRVNPESSARLQEAHQATGHRDATMEDVHAMVMAIVDQELRDGQSNWTRRAEDKSLLTLRDFAGAMLVHNLLLAGAQGKDPRAHKLFLEIVHKIPRLLLDVHDGRLIFHGEGPLHVLAVNGRSMDEAEVVEKVLIDCLRTFRRGIDERKISPEELVSSRQWMERRDIKFPHTKGTKPVYATPAYDEARGQLRTLRLALRQQSTPTSTPTLHLSSPPNLSPGEEGSQTGHEGDTTRFPTVRLHQQGRDAPDAPAVRVRRSWPVFRRSPHEVLWRDTHRLLRSLRHEGLARGAGGRPQEGR